jgi:hypothetical protein
VEGREVQVQRGPECFHRVRVTLQERGPQVFIRRDHEVYMGGNTVFAASAADSYQEDCTKDRILGDSTRGCVLGVE